MISRHFAFLVWLILMAVFVFAITASPKRRRWRWKLLLVIAGIWLMSAGLFVPGFLERKPFFHAVSSGEVGQVTKLISENPELVRSRTLMGNTALHVAVESGNTNTVMLLLNAGADVNARGDSSATPLHVAAFSGNAQITEILLDAGANVNAVGGRHSDTALDIAAFRGHANVVKLLLAHGADINMKNMLHKTALQLAQESGRSNVIAILTNPPASKP